jgi:hypothetical protein
MWLFLEKKAAFELNYLREDVPRAVLAKPLDGIPCLLILAYRFPCDE